MCVTAAGGVLTSLGIATIGMDPWFLPVVAVLLVIGQWGFWQSAKLHRKIWPLVVAVLSSVAVVTGRLFELPTVLWVALGALAIAYVSDSLFRKPVS